jgi:lipopolysaccharide transport system permease protein
MMRVIILHGEWPNALAYASSLVASLLIFYAGRTLFMRKKTILVDII